MFSDFLLPHLFDFLELSQAEVFEPSLEILKPETYFFFIFKCKTTRQKSTRNKNMQFSKQRQEKSHKHKKLSRKLVKIVFKDKIGYNTKREFVKKKDSPVLLTENNA